MELNERVVDILKSCGVGRRKLHDPFFQEKPPLRFGVYDLDDEDLCHEIIVTACPVPGCRHTSSSLQQHASHYDLAHRYSCATCRRTLPSPHLLDLHLQEAHDSFFTVSAQRKPSYCCYIEECKEKFWTAENRFQHCVAVHKLPKDFRLEHTVKDKNKKKKHRATNAQGAEDISGTGDMCVDEQAGSPASFVQRKTHKNFSFGHSKNKAFPKQLLKQFTHSEITNTHIDMDAVINELRESLPD